MSNIVTISFNRFKRFEAIEPLELIKDMHLNYLGESLDYDNWNAYVSNKAKDYMDQHYTGSPEFRKEQEYMLYERYQDIYSSIPEIFHSSLVISFFHTLEQLIRKYCYRELKENGKLPDISQEYKERFLTGGMTQFKTAFVDNQFDQPIFRLLLLLTNTLKHSDGTSKKALKEEHPNMFKWPGRKRTSSEPFLDFKRVQNLFTKVINKIKRFKVNFELDLDKAVTSLKNKKST